VDAVEIFNARCMIPNANQLAKEFALEYGLPGTAGSDAHTAQELGRAVLILPPFEGTDGLRGVIKDAKVRGRMSPFWVHFYSRYASQSKQLP
jgi:predicted metal-dependent phosphoesterase TrpH